MSTFFQLIDVTTGNLVTEFGSEDEVIEALHRVQGEDGDQPILDFALFLFHNGKPRLVAKQDELIRYIARARHRFANQDDQEDTKAPSSPTTTVTISTAKIS